MSMLLLLMLVPATVRGQCFTKDDVAQTYDPSTRRNLYKWQQEFAIDMLNVANNMSGTENVFFSPFSVYNALLLAYFTAANHTEEELKKVLHIPPTQTKLSTMEAYSFEKVFQSILRNTASKYELLNSNRLYVSDVLKVRDCMQDLFKNEIKTVDFMKNSKAALNAINKWVANQTKDQIKDILDGGRITGNTKLVLVNAAYFKGIWKYQFQLEANKKEFFYINSVKRALVTMMKQKAILNHLISHNLGVHVLELPYNENNISFIILLPPFANPNGITKILKELKAHDIFSIVTEEMMQRPVEVVIPKFSVENKLQLVTVLNVLGFGDLFADSADLSGLTGTPELKVDDAVHKAKITVDEDGEAVGIVVDAPFDYRSSPPLPKFICNHPFVYIVLDKHSRTMLFIGVFKEPPSE